MLDIAHCVMLYRELCIPRHALHFWFLQRGALCCAWKPLGERKVALDFPSSKTGTDPPFFGGRVYPSPDRHWQYIFTSNNCFSPSKKNLEKERRNICDTKEQLFLVWWEEKNVNSRIVWQRLGIWGSICATCGGQLFKCGSEHRLYH